MNFFKENWKMLVIVLIVTVLFPIVILTPSRYGTISYDTGLTIVGYGGSILGGFLTLYGVWWTIKNQEEQKRKDLAIQYMPLITCNEYEITTNNIENNILNAISTSVYSTFKEEILDSNLKEIKIILKLTNHGRGEAIVTNVKSGLAIYPAKDDNFINEAHDNPLDYSNTIIPVSQSKNINLILSFDKTKPIPKKMIFSICLTYFSHFDNNRINMNTSISIKIDKKIFINDGKIELDLFSTDNTYDSQQKKI